MNFDTYTISDQTLNGLAVGRDGKVYVQSSSLAQEHTVRVFNTKKKVFENHTANFSIKVTAMDADSDGNIWGVDTSSPATVYRISSSGASKSFSISNTTSSATDLTIGSDGTVYVVVGSLLYRMVSGTSSFSKFSTDDVQKIAVGLSGDIWILDSNYVVQQYTGSKFENRPFGQSVTANDIGAGEDGTVYIGAQSDNLLKKWNATNSSFDTVKNTNADLVDVDEDGRPWIAYTSDSNDIKRGKD